MTVYSMGLYLFLVWKCKLFYTLCTFIIITCNRKELLYLTQQAI